VREFFWLIIREKVYAYDVGFLIYVRKEEEHLISLFRAFLTTNSWTCGNKLQQRAFERLFKSGLLTKALPTKNFSNKNSLCFGWSHLT
jgi:Ni,Fe-hydrogenase I cytochrome b subunit